MCHNKTIHKYEEPIRDQANSILNETLPTMSSVVYGYESAWFTLGRATSIGQCLKCQEIYAASDSRFGIAPPDGYKSLYLS